VSKKTLDPKKPLFNRNVDLNRRNAVLTNPIEDGGSIDNSLDDVVTNDITNVIPHKRSSKKRGTNMHNDHQIMGKIKSDQSVSELDKAPDTEENQVYKMNLLDDSEFPSPIRIPLNMDSFDNNTPITHQPSFLNILNSNLIPELTEEKHNSHKKRSDNVDDVRIGSSKKDNIDLFNLAEKNIIKRKNSLMKNNHVSFRTESPLVEIPKSSSGASFKNINSNKNLDFNTKNENNNNNENEIENEKQIEQHRKITKIKRVCDSLSENEEELEFNNTNIACLLIYPDSDFKKWWDFIIAIVNFYFMIIAPFVIAFGDNVSQTMYIIEIIFDVIFIFDLLINFFVPFKEMEEELVINQHYMIAHYVSGWFLIDLLSAFPANTIFNSLEILNANKKFVLEKSGSIFSYNFLRFFKLLKLFKVYYSDDEETEQENKSELMEKLSISAAEARIIKFSLSFVISVHIFSCVWIFVGMLDTPNWMIDTGVYSQGKFDIYVASVYFNLTTIFTIGYGDILAVSFIERIFNILIMAIGVCIYSFAVSSVSTLITSYDGVTQRYLKNLEILEEMSKKYPIDGTLYLKVLKFINYDFKFNKTDKYAFIGELPNKTRNDLLYDMYKNMISNFTFFKYGMKFNNEDFNSKIVLNMRPVRLFKGDLILRQNDRVGELIFVNQGSVSAQLSYNNRTAKIFELRKFDHFGDIFVLSNDGSPIDLVVKSKTCELYIIKKDELLSIAKEFPEICNEIFRVSTKNYKRMKVVIDKKKKKLEEENGKEPEKQNELENEKKNSSEHSDDDMDNEDESDDEEEEEEENNLDKLKKEKTKELIATANLDVIKEADENDDDEMKVEKNNDIQEDGDLSPVKNLSHNFDNNEDMDIFLNKDDSPDNKKISKRTSKDSLNKHSNACNLLHKETFQSFNNFHDSPVKKEDDIIIENGDVSSKKKKSIFTKSTQFLNQNHSDDSQSCHESVSNSVINTNNQMNNEKEDNISTSMDITNTIFNNQSSRHNIGPTIQNNIKINNSNFMIFSSTPPDNFLEPNSMIQKVNNNFIQPFINKEIISKLENNILKENSTPDIGGEHPLRKVKSTNNVSFFSNLDFKSHIQHDNTIISNMSEGKDTSSVFNDDSKWTKRDSDVKKTKILQHMKTNLDGGDKFNKMFSDVEHIETKGRSSSIFKQSLSSTLTEFKLKNNCSKTLIPTDVTNSPKKNSMLKSSITRRAIELIKEKNVKKINNTEKRKNIFRNVQSHIEASVKIEKDPTAFMMKELTKAEKKLKGDNKRKEMKRIINKLDQIYELLNKKK
jgi:CRP-like cAMP-binding protein